jgi:hypothetical protein
MKKKHYLNAFITRHLSKNKYYRSDIFNANEHQSYANRPVTHIADTVNWQHITGNKGGIFKRNKKLKF